MGKLWDFFNGYKSYIVAVAAIGYGVYMGIWGGMAWADVLPFILGGGALAGIKSALAKIGIVV